MAHANHQRNKFSEDSQSKGSSLSNAALRGAMLAFAKPHSELQHPPYTPAQNVKATSAASSAFKERHDFNRSTLSIGASQPASIRNPSPSRSFVAEKSLQRQTLGVNVGPGLPRSRSPLSPAASVAAYRISPQPTGRRSNSTQSGLTQWDGTEEEEAQDQTLTSGTVSDVNLWLEDLNKPRPPPRFYAPKPFRRGMTLRPQLKGPSGTAVSASGNNNSLSGSIQSDVMRIDTGLEVKSPQPIRPSIPRLSHESAIDRISSRSLSTDMLHDVSDFDMYEPSTYGNEALRLAPDPGRTSDEDDASDGSSSDPLEADTEVLTGRFLAMGSESNLDFMQAQSVHSHSTTAPIPIPSAKSKVSAAPSRPSMDSRPSLDARTSLSSRPTSFISEAAALHSRKPVSLATSLRTRGPPILTSGWRSSASSSIGNPPSAAIASSLATSRAPSPLKSLRPFPLTRRHTEQNNQRRTPGRTTAQGPRSKSPPRVLMRTLRQIKSSSSDEDIKIRKPKNHFHIRKHPNKHHEGDRKRWRDEITPRELKRYEGLWAANRGLLLVSDKQQAEQDPAVQALKLQVSNLVVKDLWVRSRLPADVLEEVYDLVDRERMGKLSKDEFVVGLWLVDQRLKGRKLPMKVSHSVWASARGMYGLKMPKLKDMPG